MNSRAAGRRAGWIVASSALYAAALSTLPAGADPGSELSASVGLGPFAVGIGTPRFAVVPSGSIVLRGERWLLRCDDAVMLVGTTGGRSSPLTRIDPPLLTKIDPPRR